MVDHPVGYAEELAELWSEDGALLGVPGGRGPVSFRMLHVFEIADGLLPWARQIVLGSPRPAKLSIVVALDSPMTRVATPLSSLTP